MYKTIILEMLQQRPEMHEHLRRERQLLTAVEIYARELKRMHEDWKATLQTQDSDPMQISSAALEMALKDMEAHLPSAPESDQENALSLDEAMAFIRNHTSRK